MDISLKKNYTCFLSLSVERMNANAILVNVFLVSFLFTHEKKDIEKSPK